MINRRIDNRGIVDHREDISFYWENKKMFGKKGDSLAAALLANNQHIIGRSFKYHRPRSVMSAGVEEAGAIVSIRKRCKKNGEYSRKHARVI